MPAIFFRDMYTNNLSVENADNKQSDLLKMFGNLIKGKKSSEKISFLKILVKARKDVLNCFESNIFPIKKMPDTTPRHTWSKTPRLNEHFINDIKNNERNINSEVFNEYFRYQNAFLAENLFRVNQLKHNKIVKKLIIQLMN